MLLVPKVFAALKSNNGEVTVKNVLPEHVTKIQRALTNHKNHHKPAFCKYMRLRFSYDEEVRELNVRLDVSIPKLR